MGNFDGLGKEDKQKLNNPILKNQNEPEYVKLLKASSYAYSKAKRGENNIKWFLLILAIAYPICYLLIKNHTLELILYGCSFVLTILIEIFADSIKGNVAQGALFKEQFDTKIFNMRWKSTLEEPLPGDIGLFSNQYRGKEEIKDWYSQNLSASIEHNIAVAVLQFSNTSWDINLRKVYRRFLIYILMFYSIILSVFIVAMKIDALTIFLLLFSLLPFFTYFISLIREQYGAIEKRVSVSKHLYKIIKNKINIDSNELRDIQDEIYSIRKEGSKVPNFYSRWFRTKGITTTGDLIEEVNKIYSS